MKNLAGLRLIPWVLVLLWIPLWAQNSQPTDQPKRILSEHRGIITSLAFSPDNETLVSVSQDGEMVLWNPTTGEIKLKLESKPEVFRSVAFSPDGQLIASGSGNRETGEQVGRFGLMTIWDANTGKVRHRMKIGATLSTFESQPGWVFSVAFSPDGKMVAGGLATGEIRLMDSQTGKDIRSLRQHSNRVNSLAFSADGRTLASGGDDEFLILWDVATWKVKQKIKMKDMKVRSVCFAPDGKSLISASTLFVKKASPTIIFGPVTTEGGDSNFGVTGSRFYRAESLLKLWDVETGKLKLDLATSRETVFAVAFSPDGQRIANAVADQTIRLVTVNTGDVQTFTGHTGSVITITFSPDGKLLASAGTDKIIRLWGISPQSASR